jgi:hypothetical protein
MTTRAEAPTSAAMATGAADLSRLFQDGIVAGTVGAVTIALWFLLLDALSGRPLYTPTVLGTALFRGGAGLESPHTLPVSFDMVLAFTWLHEMVFVVIGGLASLLLAQAERRPNLGFGIVLLFVVFEFGFIAVAMVFAESALRALTMPAILVGNLFAAATMGLYLWRRHPQLHIEP